MTGLPAARGVTALAVDRFIEAAERERLALYRMHLQETVRSASPLTLDFIGHFGVDLSSGLESIRPPSRWPWRSRGVPFVTPMAHSSLAAYHYVDPRRRAVHGLLGRHAANPGFVHFGEGDGLLVFHFTGAWLSMEGRIGACDVRVVKGMAALTLPAGVPDTLVVGMVGREVDALVENPALAGRGYRVRRVREAKADAGPTLVFATGRRRFAMPWAGLLAEEHARRSGRLAAGDIRNRRDMQRATGAELVADTYACRVGDDA